MRLTLLIPELLWSEPGDTEANDPASGSALAKILAQRHFVRQPHVGWEASLLRLAGLRADSSLAVLRAAGETLPLAARLIDAERARHWLCADPVHLRFHQDRLILADAHELALRSEELAALTSRLNAAFAGRAEFFFSTALRGYLRLTEALPDTPTAAQPLSRKIGCEVRPGDFGDSAALRGLANEIQMLLHSDPVNEARNAAGQPTVNALWLWGSGNAPATGGGSSIDAIGGDHPLVTGIAKTLGLPLGDTTEFADATGAADPTNAAGVADIVDIADTAHAATTTRTAPKKPRHTLRLIDTLNTPTHYQNSENYAAAWRALDRAHLDPALAALRSWRLQRLDLVAPVVFGELHWQLSPLNAWTGRFSRRRWRDLGETLASHAPHES